MAHRQWSERNESLNAFCDAMQNGTRGLLRDLSIELAEVGCVVVRGTSRSYYGVQRAIQTAKEFGNGGKQFTQTRLLLSVDGVSLKLVVTHSDGPRESASTRGVSRHPELTPFASA